MYIYSVDFRIDGECYEYQWMGGPQLIWCQRSDGLNVTGAVQHHFTSVSLSHMNE